MTDEDCQVGLASSLVELLKVEQDEENLYRSLVALGTLVCFFSYYRYCYKWYEQNSNKSTRSIAILSDGSC